MNDQTALHRVVRSEHRGRIGIVTIDRPERRNALNLEVKRELVAQGATAGDDEELWAREARGTAYVAAGASAAPADLSG